jgi:hypothetical protein
MRRSADAPLLLFHRLRRFLNHFFFSNFSSFGAMTTWQYAALELLL